jgi:iron complex transport system substrate-binding protein
VPGISGPAGPVAAKAGNAEENGGEGAPETLVLGMPARRVLTMTTTNLPHFEAIGRLDALVGVGSGAYVCNETVKARLAAGTLRSVGDEASVDVEAVADLRPDLVLAFAVASWSNPALKKLNEAGLPVVLEAAYMEPTPLGRAEWIKFTAAFFGDGAAAAADSAFAGVDSAYGALAALARTATRRPTVVVNAPFRGAWWIPGGRSYVARFLEDAGADYLWSGDTTEGSLSLDLEAVLAKAGNADYWLNPGPWRSLADGQRRDPRHALFRSFREGRVWNQDRRLCGAGNDFFEKGSARPDWILADLIALFHPELLPGHRFRWYRRLEAT